MARWTWAGLALVGACAAPLDPTAGVGRVPGGAVVYQTYLMVVNAADTTASPPACQDGTEPIFLATSADGISWARVAGDSSSPCMGTPDLAYKSSDSKVYIYGSNAGLVTSIDGSGTFSAATKVRIEAPAGNPLFCLGRPAACELVPHVVDPSVRTKAESGLLELTFLFATDGGTAYVDAFPATEEKHYYIGQADEKPGQGGLVFTNFRTLHVVGTGVLRGEEGQQQVVPPGTDPSYFVAGTVGYLYVNHPGGFDVFQCALGGSCASPAVAANMDGYTLPDTGFNTSSGGPQRTYARRAFGGGYAIHRAPHSAGVWTGLPWDRVLNAATLGLSSDWQVSNAGVARK